MDRGVLWATIHRVAESDMTKVTDPYYFSAAINIDVHASFHMIVFFVYMLKIRIAEA